MNTSNNNQQTFEIYNDCTGEVEKFNKNSNDPFESSYIYSNNNKQYEDNPNQNNDNINFLKENLDLTPIKTSDRNLLLNNNTDSSINKSIINSNKYNFSCEECLKIIEGLQ